MRDIGEESGRVERSPADVLRLVVAAIALVLLLVVEGLFGETLVGFGADLLRGLDALPQWMVDLVVVVTRALALIVLGGGLVWSIVCRRWRMLGTVGAAAVFAGVMAWLVSRWIEDSEQSAPVDVTGDITLLGNDGFPTPAGIGVVAAVLTAAAPWLSRRWRRAGWALIVGLLLTRFLAVPVSFDSLGAALIGWLCGAAALVAFGAPSKRPTMAAVVDGLGRVGLPVATLERAGVDARGSTPYFGVDAGGAKLFVKALGDDERSADLLFRLYRGVQPRRFGDERPFSSLRRGVEHEAFVALAADSLGVRTPQLRAFATAEPNGYVLAYEAIAGRSLDRLDPQELTDEVLASIWGLVGELQRHRIAHRDLRLANIFLDDHGQVWLIDFGFSEMAASELLLATDVAELIASSSLYVGPERAVAHAAWAVDAATLALAADRLRPWALSGATRTAHKERPGLLGELRAGILSTVGPAAVP